MTWDSGRPRRAYKEFKTLTEGARSHVWNFYGARPIFLSAGYLNLVTNLGHTRKRNQCRVVKNHHEICKLNV